MVLWAREKKEANENYFNFVHFGYEVRTWQFLFGKYENYRPDYNVVCVCVLGIICVYIHIVGPNIRRQHYQ